MRLLAAAFAVPLLLGPAGAAMAQDDYPPGTDVECVQTKGADGAPKTTFVAGEIIIVDGFATGGRRCFNPNSFVDIFFVQSEVKLATVQAEGNGNYSTQGMGTRIPDGARAGSAVIRANGGLDGQAVAYSRTITITAAPVSPRLPVTGRDLALLSLWAVVLMLGGTTLVVATWKRWREARLHSTAPGVHTGLSQVEESEVEPYRVTTWKEEGLAPAVAELPDLEAFVPLETEDPADTTVLPVATAEPTLEPPAAELDEEPDIHEELEEDDPETSAIVRRLQEEIGAWNKR